MFTPSTSLTCLLAAALNGGIGRGLRRGGDGLTSSSSSLVLSSVLLLILSLMLLVFLLLLLQLLLLLLIILVVVVVVLMVTVEAPFDDIVMVVEGMRADELQEVLGVDFAGPFLLIDLRTDDRCNDALLAGKSTIVQNLFIAVHNKIPKILNGRRIFSVYSINI